jgi:tRNA A-37 threonylcarbamoyl transferase component Bud32
VADSEPDDDLVDRVVERIMLGQDPDVEGLIAAAPDLPPATRAKLRKLVGTFGTLPLQATVRLPRGAALPFTELGPYRLLAPMGEGGMGMVYLAEHRFLERRVALKLIRPELALSSAARQRFQREAMRIASLRHENIVSVYDAGEHEGVAFLAMEVVEGPGLDQLLQTARDAGRLMDPAEAVRHVRDIALALECAHGAGIIHRDVKPSNVRIAPDGRALLLDFGLSFSEEAASLSSLAHFRGTPQYASPEQVDSGAAEIDARTDVYSLGCTLYECLTGQVPFAGASMIQLFHQILAQDPPEPRKLNERVDEQLNGIVLRALAKRRELRFGSAAEMARALEQWLESAGRTAPAARRGRSGTRKLVIAAALLCAGAAGWFAVHESGPATAAVPRAAARSSTPLFGDSSRAFDQRLDQWAPLIGAGTFGADEDSLGVIGLCVEGICAEPYVLPRGTGCVRGRIAPIAAAPGARTRAAGAGIEFSDGRIVALLLVPSDDGYEVRVCELRLEGNSGIARGPELDSRKPAARASQPLDFRLAWNETDTQIDWGDAGSFSIPSRWRGSARPSRFLLIVERGSARFEELLLEES